MSWRFSPEVRQQLFPGERSDEEEVTDRAYVDFVQQFRQSELVAMIAAVAPGFSFNQSDYATKPAGNPVGAGRRRTRQPRLRLRTEPAQPYPS
jgi:hypothetical protein